MQTTFFTLMSIFDKTFIQQHVYFWVRYVGYSYIQCAWYAFPFEALEVFTFYSLQVNKNDENSQEQ